ncbi:hypothetical protein [Pontibacter sp. G13]|uniref:hypothetical protein n=1 Tax=Pontibacter sp. G13 TaxID=3074898 RepID=UPI00288B4D7E|nr:hypothetical protein [Pontibacter sp. G13]WNJ17636.1 hypothetical protein RJD25_22525 [Pontibacter sp. G13]
MKANMYFRAILCLLLLGAFGTQQISAQDRGINYQAVLSDATDQPLSNALVNVRFTISNDIAQVFQETHSGVSTSEKGHLSLIIGSQDFPSFNAIDWSNGTFELQVEVNDGSGYVDLGTTIIESVPFAKSSIKATNMSLSELVDVSDVAPSAEQVLTWDGSAWVPAPAASSSLWQQANGNPNDVYYDQGRVGIGTNFPTSPLHVYDSIQAVRHANIETGDLSVSNDALQIKVGDNSSDDGQFIEFEKGNNIIAKINVDGSAEFTAVEFPDGTSMNTAAAGPLAFGCISSGATINSGSGNYTVTWNSNSDRYEIDIDNNYYFFTDFATVVTPNATNVHKWSASSSGGKLLVYLYDSSGNKIQGVFYFVTYE